jgi:hypothetical protein
MNVKSNVHAGRIPSEVPPPPPDVEVHLPC